MEEHDILTEDTTELICEEEQVQEIFEQEQYRSEEEFDQLLSHFVQSYQETHTIQEDQKELLHQLLIQPKEEMNLESYIKLMYLQGIVYEEAGNKNGARYCAMRMLWIKECLERPRKRKPRFLLFHSYEFTQEELAFLETYTGFIRDIYADINKKLFLLTAILFAISFVLLAFVLKANLLVAFVEALILGALNYLLQKKRMPDVFQKNQTEASAKYIEEDLMEFDRLYRY